MTQGGDGFRRHGDANINQSEADRLRQGQAPLVDGNLISPVPTYAFTGASAFTANRVVLFTLPLLDRDTILEECRLRVTTLSAGQNIRVALFTFDLVRRTFTKIAGSAATFSTAATGLLLSKLGMQPRLVANTPYFLGFKASDAVAQVASIASGSGILNHLYVANPAGDIYASYTLAQMTRTSVGPVPGVVYLSRMWRDVV